MFSGLSKAWRRKEAIPFRELEDNIFLVEFDSEQLWKKATNGGPWKHKGDAVTFVPYDGVKRLSEVVIESIALWVRIYDIPMKMTTERFFRALGAKLGEVIEVGDAVKNYKSVRIDHLLERAISRAVHINVAGHGQLEFMARYENIRYFCFGCGRIGHPQRECPKEESNGDGVNFGKELRCSPQKMEVGRRMTIPADIPAARRGLHFSGDQKRKVMSTAGSTNTPPGSKGPAGTGRGGAAMQEVISTKARRGGR